MHLIFYEMELHELSTFINIYKSYICVRGNATLLFVVMISVQLVSDNVVYLKNDHKVARLGSA